VFQVVGHVYTFILSQMWYSRSRSFYEYR